MKKRFGTSLAVTGALLAGGCSNLEQPINNDAIRNEIAAGSALGKTANDVLARLGLNTIIDEELRAGSTPVNTPSKKNEFWATFRHTIASPVGTGTCDLTVTARNNPNGSLGGWTYNGATNQPAVTNLQLSGQNQKIEIVSPVNGISFGDGKEATLTINDTTYSASPEGNQQQLTDPSINQAVDLASAMLTFCGVPKIS